MISFFSNQESLSKPQSQTRRLYGHHRPARRHLPLLLARRRRGLVLAAASKAAASKAAPSGATTQHCDGGH